MKRSNGQFMTRVNNRVIRGHRPEEVAKKRLSMTDLKVPPIQDAYEKVIARRVLDGNHMRIMYTAHDPVTNKFQHKFKPSHLWYNYNTDMFYIKGLKDVDQSRFLKIPIFISDEKEIVEACKNAMIRKDMEDPHCVN